MRSMLFSCMFVFPLTLMAADKRLMTPEDLWRVKRVGPPSTSPDGKWAAVEVTEFDLASNDSKSQIWLLSTDGKTQKQVTTFAGKNSGPKWSPDGKSIAFTSKRGGDDVAQIYVISPEGGEARRVSKTPFALASIKWAADSSKIYGIGWTWPDTVDDAAYKKRDKEKADAKSKAMIIDEALFRFWDKWLTDGKRPFVFSMDVKSGKHENLMEGTGHYLPVQEPSEQHYDVAPDGKELCYVHDNVQERGLDVNLDLFTLRLDAKNAKPKCLTEENKASDFSPVYSPDGKKIAFLRQRIKFFYADRTRVVVLEPRSGATIEVSKLLRYRQQAGGGMNFEESELDRSCFALRWDTASGMHVEMEDSGCIDVARINLQPVAAVPGERPGPPYVEFYGDSKQSRRAQDFARGSVGELLAWVYQESSFDRPARIIHRSFRPFPIDHFNDELVAQWKLGKVENKTFKGAGDRDVQMFIVYPPDFDPAKKWPLVQMVHGGPHNAMHNDFSFRWNPHVWAAKGWVVAIVNFHGSSSFGQEFTDSITGDLGTKPMEDIMKSTDWFEQQPWIDKDRIAAAGASYGGYMMAWLNGHTDRFKTMVCHAGVYNWHSMLASDIVRGRERSLGAPPWGDLSKIDRQNAQRFAKNFKTPTLVIHGELDYRVPVTQGFEYYNTLRQKGVPTRLVYFPDENHWVLKTQNSLLWHREVLGWLEKYIGAGPTK